MGFYNKESSSLFLPCYDNYHNIVGETGVHYFSFHNCYYHCSTQLCAVVLQYLSLWLLSWPPVDGATSDIRSAYYGSATTADAEGHRLCCWPHCCATATSVLYAFSGKCQLCQWFSTGKFPFQSWTSHQLLIYVGVYSSVCFLLSGAVLDVIFTNGDQTFGFATLQPFGASSWQAFVPPGDSHTPTPEMYQVAASSTAGVWWDIKLWGLSSHPIPLISLHDREGSSFQGLVPSSGTVMS